MMPWKLNSNQHVAGSVQPFYATDDGIDMNSEWSHGDFVYRFNSLGFRGEEPKPDVPCIVTLGCSITMGVGVPEEMRWGDLVAEHYGIQHYNFGLGGSDGLSLLENAAYLLSGRIDLDIRAMLVLWPGNNRFSYWSDDWNSFSDIRGKNC
jgi:hypothetical protein